MTPAELGADETIDLLYFLDALVQRDGGLSGLEGEVCVGLRGDVGFRWWRARLGMDPPESGIIDAPSTTAHATLFLGESDARALVERGSLPKPPELMMVDGDRDLMARFFERYTSKTSWLGMQIQTKGGQR